MQECGCAYRMQLKSNHLSTISVCLSPGLLLAREIDYHCTAGDEYLYATPGTQCTGYYKCQQRQVTKYNCEQGSYFNYFRQSCVRFEGELREGHLG